MLLHIKIFFTLLKNNQVRLGYSAFKDLFFDVPVLQKGKKYKIIDGVPRAEIAISWYTNLPVESDKRLNLHSVYKGNETKYPTYDNFDAINVDRVKDIPCDYYGLIGVPISFIMRYDPEQFILLGLDIDMTFNRGRCRIGERCCFARLIICRRILNDNLALTKKVA